MNDPKLRVKFYSTPMGNEPVKEWLQSLSKELKKIIGEDIRAAQKGWPNIGMPLIRHIEGKISEIRSTIPDGIVRIFFVVENGYMALLHYVVKKTQKTADRDFDLVRKRLKEWVD